MRRCIAVAGSLVLSAALAGCGWVGRAGDTSKPDGFPLRGYVSVSGAAAGTAGTPCLAPSGTVGIAAGTEVHATDAQGAVVGTAVLGTGVLASSTDGYRCNFPFEIANMAGSRPTYRIKVGDRPSVDFQTARLREGAPAVIEVRGGS